MSINDKAPIQLADAPEREARLSVGARGDKVQITLGGFAMLLTPDQADMVSLSLQRFALEARHGGAVPGLTSELPKAPGWEDTTREGDLTRIGMGED